MKTLLIKVSAILFLLMLLSCSEQKVEDHSNHDHGDMDKDHLSELVREGIIDVESIDKNNDGKIYECPMDWNVLSDKAGSCPTCGMDLKEYSLDEVKANLIKYGYEFKK